MQILKFERTTKQRMSSMDVNSFQHVSSSKFLINTIICYLFIKWNIPSRTEIGWIFGSIPSLWYNSCQDRTVWPNIRHCDIRRQNDTYSLQNYDAMKLPEFLRQQEYSCLKLPSSWNPEITIIPAVPNLVNLFKWLPISCSRFCPIYFDLMMQGDMFHEFFS